MSTEDARESGAAKLARTGLWTKKAIDSISIFLIGFTAVCGAFMMLHIVADVTGRYFWVPLPGTFAIVCYWYMLPFIFLPIAYVEYKRQHIVVTFFTDRMPEFWSVLLGTLGLVLGLAVFFVLGWETWDKALKMFAVLDFHEEIFKIPIWPGAFYLPIGCWALCLQLLVHIYENCLYLVRIRRRA